MEPQGEVRPQGNLVNDPAGFPAGAGTSKSRPALQPEALSPSLQLWKLSRACTSMMSSPDQLELASCCCFGIPNNGKPAQRRKGATPLFPPCFLSVIWLSPKLSKPMICLRYLQLSPRRHRCFYGKSPCFLFFLKDINRFPSSEKTPCKMLALRSVLSMTSQGSKRKTASRQSF